MPDHRPRTRLLLVLHIVAGTNMCLIVFVLVYAAWSLPTRNMKTGNYTLMLLPGVDNGNITLYQNIDINGNYTISENTRRDNSTNITIQKDAHSISKLQDRYRDMRVFSTGANHNENPFQEINATLTRKCEKCDNLVNDSNVGHSIETQEVEKRTLNSTDINQDSGVTIVVLHDTSKPNSETQRRGQSSTATDNIGVISRLTEADHGRHNGARRKVNTKYQTTTIDVLALLRSHIDSSKLQYKTLTKKSNKDSWKSDSADDTENWSAWSKCDKPCGTGEQERRRRCGYACLETETKPCNRPSCSADDNEAVDKSDFSQQADDSHEYSGEFIDTEEDACGTWMKCEDESVKQYISKLSELPGCPCYYPVNIKSNNRVWDRKKGNFYNWVDASGPIEKLNIYKPGAFYCIRSLLIPGYDVLAAQQCCYDKYMRLTTRGRDAGTPNLISPQLSVELHKKVDILPWVICKGDWTRYNQVLSPNNVHDCRQNPDRREYLRQIKEAQNY